MLHVCEAITDSLKFKNNYFYYFFFFQAEDGIRDLTVTGVQTCALPIYRDEDLGRLCRARTASPAGRRSRNFEQVDRREFRLARAALWNQSGQSGDDPRRSKRRSDSERSEERRVGKECRSRWVREQ